MGREPTTQTDGLPRGVRLQTGSVRTDERPLCLLSPSLCSSSRPSEDPPVLMSKGVRAPVIVRHPHASKRFPPCAPLAGPATGEGCKAAGS